MPKFSIVIPLYNKEKDIIKTLNSVFKQTYIDFEVIVVDDGSTDESVEKVEGLNNNSIQLFLKQNEGVSTARNFGVEKANAEYIVFLDADDYWYPNHLETINSLTEEFSSNKWFATSYEKKYSNQITSPMDSPLLQKGTDWQGEVSDFFKNSLTDCLAWTSSICMKKDFFLSLGGYDTSLTHGEDTDLWIRAALKEKVIFSNKITAQHNLTGSNRSSKVAMKNRNNFYFEKFSEEEKSNSSLKKYLDLNRYSLAIKYKLSNDLVSFNKVIENIEEGNLNRKQNTLLKQPRFVLQSLLYLKSILNLVGIKLSSF